MKSKIIKTGNSCEIRIPRAFIDLLGFEEDVEIVIEGNTLAVSPVRKARAGWDSSFKLMSELIDDRVIDGEDREMFAP